MAFSNDEIEQLRTVVREEMHMVIDAEMRAVVHDEVRSELESGLQPIKEEITRIKEKLDRFFNMENGDIKSCV